MGGSLRQKLPTFVLATIIAMLIWLYAEGENLREDTVSVDVMFVDPAGNKLAIEPRTASVRVTVQAPTSSLAAVKKISTVRLSMQEKPGLETYPRQMLILRERLASLPDFERLGAGVLRTDPETVSVSVQRLEPVTLPVELTAGEVDLKTAATVQPSEVTIAVPASLTKAVEGLKLRVMVDARAVASFTPNNPYTLELPISMSEALAKALGDYAIQIPLPKAQVNLTLRSQEETYEHPSIPIRTAAVWTLLDEYRVEVVDRVALEGIVLRGPSKVIEQIRRGEVKVWADIDLTSKDFETPITSAPVRLTAPQGVFAETPLPTVNIRITKRTTDGKG